MEPREEENEGMPLYPHLKNRDERDEIAEEYRRTMGVNDRWE